MVMMAVSVFLVPIYSRYFSRADYGVMETFNMFINMLMLILPCGISQSMFRMVYGLEEDKKKSVFFSTILHYYLILGAIFLVIVIAGNLFFTKLLIADSSYRNIFLASCATIVLQMLNNYNMDILRSQFKKLEYLIVSVGSAVCLAVSGIVAVLYFKMGIKGFFYASFFTHFLFTIIGGLFNYKWFGFSFSKKNLNELLRIGLPYIPAGLSLVLMKFLDRIVVQRMLGLEELGIYAMAIKISTLFDIVGMSFSTAFVPIAMKMAHEQDAKQHFKSLFLKVLAGLLFAALCFSLASSSILKILVDKKFWECAPFIFFLIFATLINYTNYILGVGIIISNKTKYISIPTLAGGLVNLFFCILLAKWFGLIGVSISLVLGSITYTSVSAYISEKVYPVHYPFMKGIMLLLFGGIIFYGINYFDLLNFALPIVIAVKSIVAIMYLALIIFGLKIFEIAEAIRLSKMILGKIPLVNKLITN